MRPAFLIISSLVIGLIPHLTMEPMKATALSLMALFFWFMVLAIIFSVDADRAEKELEECREKCNTMEIFVEKVADRIEEILDEKLRQLEEKMESEKQCEVDVPEDRKDLLEKLEEVKEKLKQI